MGLLDKLAAATQERDARKQKGETGEADLAEWLKHSRLSFVAICQARDTFAPLFAGEVKRPDFMVLLDSVGLIAVDAKNFEVTEWDGIDCFTLSVETELRRAVAFERLFRMPLWYAYRCGSGDRVSWYWISALKAVEVGTRREGCNGEFLTIALEQFAHVVEPADLAKLYIQRLPGASSIAALPLAG